MAWVILIFVETYDIFPETFFLKNEVPFEEKRRPGIGAPTFNPSTWEAEVGREITDEF